MTRILGSGILVALVLAVAAGGAAPARAVDKYQFMKASENRVWRLNKESGEITVCTLRGERLLCAMSSEAAIPPPRSYAEIKAAEQATKYKAREERQEQDEKEMKILTRVLDFFKEMIAMAKDQMPE